MAAWSLLAGAGFKPPSTSRISQTGTCLRVLRQNEVRCFALLVVWAEARSGLPIQSLAFIIEPTHAYHEQLVQFLHNTGATVYLVNPGKVRKFAEGIGILSKNDPVDADLLCTIPGVGAKTAWVMLVILGSRTFRSAPEQPEQHSQFVTDVIARVVA